MSRPRTQWPDDRERDIRKHLKTQLAKVRGTIRKVNWVNRRSAPDELVMLPGRYFFAELKRPGLRPTVAQTREIKVLRAAGITVLVLSTREEVDKALEAELLAADNPNLKDLI